MQEKKITSALIEQAVAGDRTALEAVLLSVRDPVFNLSLRMLGTFHDAEDATQDILIKILTHLSSFRGDSAFSTWAFRIAVNHLRDYKKHMFAHAALHFELYGADIAQAQLDGLPDLSQDVDRSLLAEELKLSCTNVMLQCLDEESRCIFVLGTMFRVDSRTAGEILDMTPEAYRQKLLRARRKMAEFLSDYCGEYGGGACRCQRRIDYAIQNHRLDPAALDYTSAAELPQEQVRRFVNAMEEIDGLSAQFAFCKTYESPERTRLFLQEFLHSAAMATVKDTK